MITKRNLDAAISQGARIVEKQKVSSHSGELVVCKSTPTVLVGLSSRSIRCRNGFCLIVGRWLEFESLERAKLWAEDLNHHNEKLFHNLSRAN